MDPLMFEHSHPVDFPPKGSFIVYALRKAGEIVYVGSTRNLARRLDQHEKSGKVFDAYSFIYTCSESAMHELEVRAISEYWPVLNCGFASTDKSGFASASALAKRYGMNASEVAFLAIEFGVEELSFADMSIYSVRQMDAGIGFSQ